MNVQDEILTQYEIRKSNKQKSKFIKYLRERLVKAGYAPEVIQVEEKGRGLLKSRNIVVGDPKNAKVVLGAHYDTCAVMPFPNLMAPTNPVIFWGCQIALVVMIIVTAGIIALAIGLLTGSAELAYYMYLVCLILLMIQLMVGYRNKHTANDNTSGIITLTHILETLPKEDRSKVCVVYFDNEEKGLFGSAFFYKKHKHQVENKLVINFDCVGDGDNLVTLAKRGAEKDTDYEKFVKVLKSEEHEYDVKYDCRRVLPMMFPSDQVQFKKGIGICALKKSCLGFRYVARIHTYMDTKCRKVNIDFLTKAMQVFIHEI